MVVFLNLKGVLKKENFDKNKKVVLEAKSVWKEYSLGLEKIVAIKNVSLKVFKGEFLTIMGKSGSGKSTLIHMLGCLDVPSKGEVFVDNIPVSSLNDDELSIIRGEKIGFIFQTFNLIPVLNVLQNVELPLMFKNLSEKEIYSKVKSILKLVQLEGREFHKPNELSGGQRQRVAIARALVTNPSVVIADEPTGNLDSKTGFEIISFLYSLNVDKNVTIVMVTHDEDLAKISDRTLFLKDGVILKETKRSLKDRNKALSVLKEKSFLKSELE